MVDPTDAPCRLPPPGWRCARGAGHGGPCAAVDDEGTGAVAVAPRAFELRELVDALLAMWPHDAEATAERLREYPAIVATVRALRDARARERVDAAATHARLAALCGMTPEEFDARSEQDDPDAPPDAATRALLEAVFDGRDEDRGEAPDDGPAAEYDPSAPFDVLGSIKTEAQRRIAALEDERDRLGTLHAQSLRERDDLAGRLAFVDEARPAAAALVAMRAFARLSRRPDLAQQCDEALRCLDHVVPVVVGVGADGEAVAAAPTHAAVAVAELEALRAVERAARAWRGVERGATPPGVLAGGARPAMDAALAALDAARRKNGA